MISPDQELFDYVYDASEKLGYDTYDYLPMASENAKYPFVEIGNVQQINLPTKTALGARFTISIHIWGNARMRFEVSQMTERLCNLANHVLVGEHYRFVGRPDRTDKEILNDTSVENTVLKHGILTLVFDLG